MAPVVASGLKLALGIVTLAALYGAPWLALAPNRLLPGRPVAAMAVLGSSVHALAIVLAAAIATTAAVRTRAAAQRGPLLPWLALALILGTLAAMVVFTGTAAQGLLAGAPPAARVTLGAGFWTAFVALLALAGETARSLGTSRAPTMITVVLLAGAGAVGWRLGLFDALSLAIEARARAPVLGAALMRHAVLAGAALALAVAVALPLGWLAFRSARAGAAIGAALSTVQVVPAIALFGLLVPLLALLLNAAPVLRSAGVAAIGPAPALIGVSAYLTLPLVRGFAAGLGAADPSVVEAARAMGLTQARMAWDVRLPLGLPVLAGALRVAAVQSVGLTTLGGLVGAGGLGALVFEGMAQFAPDLILLSAMPIVLLAIAVDAALSMLTGALTGGGR